MLLHLVMLTTCRARLVRAPGARSTPYSSTSGSPARSCTDSRAPTACREMTLELPDCTSILSRAIF